MTALLIDDEPAALAELQHEIGRLDLGVNILGEARNLREGLRKIESLRPDLIFLDIGMPGGSGFELLRQLKKGKPPGSDFCYLRRKLRHESHSGICRVLHP